MKTFHYAFKVKDIASTRQFYIALLNCIEGRSTEDWIDFNFFGNQLSAHVSKDIPALDYCGNVDGIKVPIPHLGCLITVKEFEGIQSKLESIQTKFIIKPTLRYEGKTGEQRTMFFLDPAGNALEFKAFKDMGQLFAK